MQIDIGCKHDVFLCYEGIASFTLGVFSTMVRYCKANTFNAVVHMGGLDKTIWFACFNGVLKQCGLDLIIIYVSIKVLEFWIMETTFMTFCTL